MHAFHATSWSVLSKRVLFKHSPPLQTLSQLSTLLLEPLNSFLVSINTNIKTINAPPQRINTTPTKHRQMLEETLRHRRRKPLLCRVEAQRAVIMAKRKADNKREAPRPALFKDHKYGHGERAMSKREKRQDKRSRIKASSSSAATKVLNTTELLEHILHQFDSVRDLVTCQGVSRDWYNLISNSLKLQQDLFFKTQPVAAVPSWNPVASSVVKSLANKLYRQSHVWAPWPPEDRLWAASCGGHFDLPKLEISIRPEFPRRPDGSTTTPPYDRLHFSQPKTVWPMPVEWPIVVAERDKETNALKTPSTNEGSWRKMFATNPPSVIHITEQAVNNPGVTYKAWTLGELVDKVIELSNQPGFADRVAREGGGAWGRLSYSSFWHYAPISDLPLNEPT